MSSYSLKGDWSALSRLSSCTKAGVWVCGTDNGELITIDQNGEAEAREASEDPITGPVRVNGDEDRCVMVVEDGVTVREYPDVKTVVEESTGRRTLPVSHVEFSCDGSKM